MPSLRRYAEREFVSGPEDFDLRQGDQHGCYAVFIQQRGRSDTTTLKDVRRTYRTSAENNLSGRKDRSSAARCTRVVDNNTIGSEVGCVYSGTVIAFKIQALNILRSDRSSSDRGWICELESGVPPEMRF